MGRKLDDIINSLPARRRAEVESLASKKVDDMLAYASTLADFRRAVGKTQTEVAGELGIKQHAVSQLEQRSDMYVSTLQRFVQSLGMRLELSLTTAKGVRIELQNFHPWQPAPLPIRAAHRETVAGTGKRRAAAAKSRKPPSRLKPASRLP